MTIAGVIKEVVTIVVRLLYSSLSVVLGLLTNATLSLWINSGHCISCTCFLHMCSVRAKSPSCRGNLVIQSSLFDLVYVLYMDSWKAWSHQDSNSMIWIECGSQDWSYLCSQLLIFLLFYSFPTFWNELSKLFSFCSFVDTGICVHRERFFLLVFTGDILCMYRWQYFSSMIPSQC
jgi:hypothetical protein